MKFRTLKLVSIFLFLSLFAITNQIHAEDPAPPPPPGDHGKTGNQGPTDAPVGSGVAVFLAFAAGLAGREYYKMKKAKAL